MSAPSVSQALPVALPAHALPDRAGPGQTLPGATAAGPSLAGPFLSGPSLPHRSRAGAPPAEAGLTGAAAPKPSAQTDPVSRQSRAILNWLRLLFRACRAKQRLDLFQACAMLAADRSTSAQAYADALLRALSAGSARALILHAPGEAALSFDERWLVSLIDALGRDDTHSRDFLLRSRLPRADRRQIGWLATRLVALSPTGTLG